MHWFKYEIFKDSQSFETLMWLENGLRFDVVRCIDYEINNCIFYTKSLDDKSTILNIGVNLEVESLQFFTSKD